jgi:hypothetical protein
MKTIIRQSSAFWALKGPSRRLLFLLVLFSISSQAQNWSTFLNSSRAVDWSGAGFTIPNYTVNCATQPTLTANSAGAASANAKAIQNSLASCDATHNVVNIPAGTYYVAGITFGSQGKQVLRGAGPNSTDLIMTASPGCSGIASGVCIMPPAFVYPGNPSVLPPSGTRQCLWTAGYSQGTTSITLNSCPGGSPPVNEMLVLDQSNDLTDNGGIYLCDSFTSSQSGGSPCTINDGASTNADGRRIGGYTYSQKQIVTIQSVSGSGTGPFTVTISPGVYFTNIRSGQNPGAWWPGTIVNEGLENVTIDGTALASNNIELVACYQCWVKNVRSIDAARAHVMLVSSANDVIRDSYFYQSQSHMEVSYTVELEQDSSILVVNNIFQQVTNPIMTGNTSGSVIAYNLSLDNIYNGGSGQFLSGEFHSHNAGNEMNLWEGNNFHTIVTDNTWGASSQGTFFRNMLSGWQTGKTAETTPLVDRSYARANNLVGNVLGQSGYHNTYESYATSSTSGVNASSADTSIYALGWTGNTDNGTCFGPPVCDPLVRSTLMRWGNYDVVTSGTKWDSAEASPKAVAYVNANFTSTYFSSLAHTLPASLYYRSQPSWWPSGKAWPPIGPDVASGNVGTCTGTYAGAQATNSSQCTGGTLNTAWASHVTSIPAQDCYLNVMGGPPDGTGSVLSFDAETCYNGSGGTNPPPTGLTATVH